MGDAIRTVKEQTFDKNIILSVLVIVSMVFNVVLGWQAVANNRLEKEVYCQKNEIVQLQGDVRHLTENVTALTHKVESLFGPRAANLVALVAGEYLDEYLDEYLASTTGSEKTTETPNHLYKE
jgi:hypothetical protein